MSAARVKNDGDAREDRASLSLGSFVMKAEGAV